MERWKLAFGSDGSPRIAHDALPVEEGEPLAIELSTFLAAVRTRTGPDVDGRAGRRALDLAFRVLESIAASPGRK